MQRIGENRELETAFEKRGLAVYRHKKILGVVPARAGSKGLPGKNIHPLLGKPLIAWTLDAARQSHYLDRTVVSTESEQIAAVARDCGGDVPFLRPRELAHDGTATYPVLRDVLERLEKQGEVYDFLALLEPTSPLREPDDIDTCIERLIAHAHAKAIVGVAKLEGAHPEFNAVLDPGSGFLRRMDGSANFKFLRRQELTDVYYFEGTIYLSDVPTLLEKQTFYHDRTLPYVVPRWKSPEIDELSDLLCVEALLKAHREGRL